MIEVEMTDGTKYTVRSLFTPPRKPIVYNEAQKERWKQLPGWGNVARYTEEVQQIFGGNMKLSKATKTSDYHEIGLSLAPNKQSGYSVCPNSTPGCASSCVYNGGITEIWPKIQWAQIARTRALFQARAEFDKQLLKELTSYAAKYPKLGCRLNVYSDLPWEKMTPWLFEKFPDVNFYDYTKVYSRMEAWCQKKFPPNYHLTFSRSEVNEEDCKKVIALGGSVTVVFRSITNTRGAKAILPETYWGLPVIDGDINDLRFLDPDPCIVGLAAKNKFGQRDRTGFVVSLNMV